MCLNAPMSAKLGRLAFLAGMAAGSLALCLALFGTREIALSGAAHSAATNSPNLTALPLGSGKTTTTSPQPGYLFQCRPMMGGPAAGGGPWINAPAGTYSLSAKPVVDGSNPWPNATFKAKVKKAVLKLTGNGLPTNHGTGDFPVRPTDDAFQYDRNPNSVSAQAIIQRLAARPKRLRTPQCVGGEVGIARNGVRIFNALDAAGQDAVAFEIQDGCSGHPQQQGQYHYHGLPACISYGSEARHSKLIGWAYDGFPIYGPIGNKGRYMRLSDLDECHGHTHKLKYQGEVRKLFHYHATHEFPYTVGCYRGTPVATGP
jgi:YHYH protein